MREKHYAELNLDDPEFFALYQIITFHVSRVESDESTEDVKHFHMKQIIFKSKKLLREYRSIPPEVGELLVDCLCNYLEEISPSSADSDYILDALHLSGKSPLVAQSNVEVLTVKFCEGFHEKDCNLPALSVSQEDIWDRLVEYKKQNYNPEQYFYLEGYYLALSGKKSISGAAFKRVLTAYLRKSDNFFQTPFPDSKARDRFKTYGLKHILAKDIKSLKAFDAKRMEKYYFNDSAT